jgi:hypothetical protein
MDIRFAKSDQEILDCWEVVKELRPHLTDPSAFLQQVKGMMQDGYRMIYVAEPGSNAGKAVAFAGFREHADAVHR